MDLLAIVSQPLVVLLAAFALFAGRTILHARRLKTATKDPDLAKIMMAGQSPNILRSHEASLSQAKSETVTTLADARRTLHKHTRDFKRPKQKKS